MTQFAEPCEDAKGNKPVKAGSKDTAEVATRHEIQIHLVPEDIARLLIYAHAGLVESAHKASLADVLLKDAKVALDIKTASLVEEGKITGTNDTIRKSQIQANAVNECADIKVQEKKVDEAQLATTLARLDWDLACKLLEVVKLIPPKEA
jgi:hypothetical protein